MSRPIMLNLPFIPFFVDVRLYGEDNPSRIETAMLSLIHAHGANGLTISEFHRAIPLGRRASNELLNAMWRRAFVKISHDDARIRLEQRSSELAENDFRGLGTSVEPISYELGYDLMTGKVFNPYQLINEEPNFRFVVPTGMDGGYDVPFDGFKNVPVPEILRILHAIDKFRNDRENSEITLEPRIPEYELSNDHVRHYKAHFQVERSTDELLVFTHQEKNGFLDPILTEIAAKLPLGAAAPGLLLYETLRERASVAPPRADQASGLMARLRRDQERLEIIAQKPEKHLPEFESIWKSVLGSFDNLVEEELLAESTRVRAQYVPKGQVENKLIQLMNADGARLLIASRATYRIDTVGDNPVKAALRDALGGKTPRIDRAILHWRTFRPDEDNDRRERQKGLDLEITDHIQGVENKTAQRRFRFLGASGQGNHMAASLALLDDRQILLSSSALVGDMVDIATGLHIEPIRNADRGRLTGFHPLSLALNNRLTTIFSQGSLFAPTPRDCAGEPTDLLRRKRLEEIAEGLLDRLPDESAMPPTGRQDVDTAETEDVRQIDLDALKHYWLLCAEALKIALDRIRDFRAEGPLVAKALFEADIYSGARDLILSAHADSEITICVCPAAEKLRRKFSVHEPFPEIDTVFLDPLRIFLGQSENARANLIITASAGGNEEKYMNFLNQIETIDKAFPNRLKVVYPSAANNKLTANTGLSCVLTEDATLIASGGILGAQIRTRNSGIRTHVGFLLRGQGHAHAAVQQLAECVPDLRVSPNRHVKETDIISPAHRIYLTWKQAIRKLSCKDLGLSVLEGVEPETIDKFTDPLFQRVNLKNTALSHDPGTAIGDRARSLLFRMAVDESDLSAMAAFADWAGHDHALRQHHLRNGVITFLRRTPFSATYHDLVKTPEGAALLVLSWLENPSNVDELLIQAWYDSSVGFSPDFAPILTNLATRASHGDARQPDLAKMNNPSQDTARQDWEQQFDALCKVFDLFSRKDYGTMSAREIRSLAFSDETEGSEFCRLLAIVQNAELSLEKKSAAIRSELAQCTSEPARTFRSKETAQQYAIDRVANFNALNQGEELVGARRTALANDWARLLADCQAWVFAGEMLDQSRDKTPLDEDLFDAVRVWLDGFTIDKVPEEQRLQSLLHARLKAKVEKRPAPKALRAYWRYPTAFDRELHPKEGTNWSGFQDAILRQEWPTSQEEFFIQNFEIQLNASNDPASHSWLGRCQGMLSDLIEPHRKRLHDKLAARFDQFVGGKACELLDKVGEFERKLADLGEKPGKELVEKRQIIEELVDDVPDADSVELASIYFREIEKMADAQREELTNSLDLEIEKLQGDEHLAAQELRKMGHLRSARMATLLSRLANRQRPVNFNQGELIKDIFRGKAMNKDIVAALEVSLNMEDGSIRNGKRTMALCQVLEAPLGITEEVAIDFTEMVADWFDLMGKRGRDEMSMAIQQKLGLAQRPSILCRLNITDDPPPKVVWKGGENFRGLLIDPCVTQEILEVSELTLSLEDILQALRKPLPDRSEFILQRIESRARFSALFREVASKDLPTWAARKTTPQTIEQDAAAILAVAERFGCRIAFEYDAGYNGLKNEIMGLCRILAEWERRSDTLWSVLSDCFRIQDGDRLFEARLLTKGMNT